MVECNGGGGGGGVDVISVMACLRLLLPCQRHSTCCMFHAGNDDAREKSGIISNFLELF